MIPLLALLWHAALGAEPAPTADPVLTAMVDEIGRASQLSLEGAPKVYFASYRLAEQEGVDLTASLGGIVRDSHGPERVAFVSVRVGTPALDNGNFASTFNFSRGFGAVGLVLSADPLAIRHDLWLETDSDYKGAVQNLARKMAARKGQTGLDPTPSFQPTPGVQASAAAAPPPDHDALAALARSLSARFLTHPDVEASRVFVATSGGRDLLVDTAGTRLIRPEAELDLRVVAMARAADGRTATDHATFIVRDAAGLPSKAALEAATDALAARMERWRTTPAATEPYVGPVIFEGDAAIDLFRRLLVPALAGTPPLGREGDHKPDPDAEALSVKRRVLPAGFTVVDDPSAEPELPSSYAYDDEGLAAQRVELVNDGIVRSLLASRIPSQDVGASNGHGRSLGDGEVAAAPSFLKVSARKVISQGKLYALALKTAGDYDLDHVLVVRRLADPSVVQPQGGFSVFFGGGHGRAASLPDPIEVVFRYADGHEEPVRGLSWNGVDRRILRDIAAAGSRTRQTFLHVPRSSSFFGGGATLGVPVTIEAPSVLVNEVELSPDTGPAPTPPTLPNPLGG